MLGDVELELVPSLAGGQLAGSLLEAPGEDLAQFFADAKLAAADQFSGRLDGRPVGHDGLPILGDAFIGRGDDQGFRVSPTRVAFKSRF